MYDNLKISIRHIATVLVMAAVASVFIYAYDTGYGAGHIAATDTGTSLPSPSTLDVIYERHNGGSSDFLHLQVDTTYTARGKGSFRMQPSCSRRLSARLFDGEYHPTDIRPEECFVFNSEAASRWRETGTTRRIAGYDCRCAEATFNGRAWQVWYTDRLPHWRRRSRRRRPPEGPNTRGHGHAGRPVYVKGKIHRPKDRLTQITRHQRYTQLF